MLYPPPPRRIVGTLNPSIKLPKLIQRKKLWKKPDCFSMSLRCYIKLPNIIISNWIRPRLQYNHIRIKNLHHTFHDRLEKIQVWLIRDSLFKRDIQGVVHPFTFSFCVYMPWVGEESIAVLVEWYSHYSVGVVKGLFYSVSMVAVNVKVEDSTVNTKQITQLSENNLRKQLQYSQHNIIHITKPRCLELLRMMQSPTPVDTDIHWIIHQ